jgi:CheY-like chemotaxis protein
MHSRVLIIEDEPIISMHLEQIVSDMGHEVVGTAMTRTRAVAEARRAAPDLVLADIQLADGSSGQDAARDIQAMFDVPVIFITAYPERLLTGERPEPTFLVTKPFAPETVIVTIGHALLSRNPAFARTD